MRLFHNIFICCCLGLLSFSLPKKESSERFDFIVAKDGSGNFTTIQSAIEACKSFPDQRIRFLSKMELTMKRFLFLRGTQKFH